MSADPHARRRPGLGELLGQLLSEARALAADYAELAVLDARRAALRLALMLACVLIAAVLIVTAWMGGVAALIVWMLGEGVSWAVAIGCAALLNVVGAGALLWWMRAMLVEMPFAALLRQLRGEEPLAVPMKAPPHAP